MNEKLMSFAMPAASSLDLRTNKIDTPKTQFFPDPSKVFSNRAEKHEKEKAGAYTAS